MFTAKQAKRLYREICTHKVGRTDPETGELIIERKRKLRAPSFKVWLRASVREYSKAHENRAISPKLHRIVFGGV